MIPRRHLLAVLVVGSLAATLVGCSSSTDSPTSPLDLSPPQAPQNLRATADRATSRDWLLWEPSASASVASYEIYVSDNPGGMTTLVATVDADSYNYVLPIVTESTTEYYRVRAIGSNRVPSAPSASVMVDRDTFSGSQPTSGPDTGIEGEN